MKQQKLIIAISIISTLISIVAIFIENLSKKTPDFNQVMNSTPFSLI